jgi:hypothetical protein
MIMALIDDYNNATEEDKKIMVRRAQGAKRLMDKDNEYIALLTTVPKEALIG